MPLPNACRQCAFFQPSATRCRRRAPVIGSEEMQIAYWPLAYPVDRCGAGATVADGTETVPCDRCVHWFRPGGIGIKPDYRQGLSVEWWEKSGYCTHASPQPSNDEDRRAYWMVTSLLDSARCGDGEEAEADEDPGPELTA